MPWPPTVSNPRSSRPPLDAGVLVLCGVAVVLLAALWQKHYITGDTIIYLAVLIPSIILHEISHGWVASKFGDPTAGNAGRLSLNPARHVDVWGTFLLPALLLITTHGGTSFGYAKPVPVNTSRMSRNKSLMVSLAGPATNIVIALFAAVVLVTIFGSEIRSLDFSVLGKVLLALGEANVVLAVFNLIPVPPLDGSAVIERFLPEQYWPQYAKFRQYSMLILLAVFLIGGTRFLSVFFDPALRAWFNLLR